MNLKKLFVTLMCAAVVLFIINLAVKASDNRKTLHLKIGSTEMIIDKNQKIKIDESSNVSPIIIDEKIFVPAKAVIESLGGEFSLKGEEKTVLVSYNNDTFEISYVNSISRDVFVLDCPEHPLKKATINDSLILKSSNDSIESKLKNNTDLLPILYNNKLFVSLKFLSDILKCTTEWDSNNSIITIKGGNS